MLGWWRPEIVSTYGGSVFYVIYWTSGVVMMIVQARALTIWTRKAVLPTTAHVAVGAAVLGTTVLLALSARRVPNRTSGSHPAFLATERVPA